MAPETKVDLSERRLRRIFTRTSFKSGGRLFGGFWQLLPKQKRCDGVRIDGEPISSLDYSQMNPRIAYGFAKQPPPVQDVYCVPGLEDEHYRDGIKQFFRVDMKSFCVSTFVGAIVLSGAFACDASAQTQADRSVEQYTCKDIIREAGDNRDVAIAFLHGYLLGKSGSSKFNLEAMEKQTDAFVEQCLDNPQAKAQDVMLKVKNEK